MDLAAIPRKFPQFGGSLHNLETVDLAAIPREFPQFGRTLKNLQRTSSAIFGDASRPNAASSSDPGMVVNDNRAVATIDAVDSLPIDWRRSFELPIAIHGNGHEVSAANATHCHATCETEPCCGAGKPRESRDTVFANEVWPGWEEAVPSVDEAPLYCNPEVLSSIGDLRDRDVVTTKEHLCRNVEVNYKDDPTGKCMWLPIQWFDECGRFHDKKCIPRNCKGIFNLGGMPYENVCVQNGEIVRGMPTHVTSAGVIIIPWEITWWCVCDMKRRVSEPRHDPPGPPGRRNPDDVDALVAYIVAFGRPPRGMSLDTAKRILGAQRWAGLGTHIGVVVRTPARR